MKLYPERDKNKSGIYAIVNMINNKMYIGKSVNIYYRMKDHIPCLNKGTNCNTHLGNAWKKYGKNNFKYIVLEYVEGEDQLADKELFYMRKYKTLNRQYGYNLRYDTRTKCYLPDETRKRMSIAVRKRNADPNFDTKEKYSHTFWKDNPEIKNEMAQKIKVLNTKYMFKQYTRENVLVKTYANMDDVILQNPSFKKSPIYATCDGHKSTYRGYKWKKELIKKI